ncbi:hypothetical protein Tco_1078529 [Tanacetum coccineum]|uniref:Uncharacterized protein n=1 Tax=Tanacetum coccineum TaxID=301880 RepID=A0ABQ5HQJ0_9ASTR
MQDSCVIPEFPIFASIGSKVGACEKKSKALPLLNIIWNEIAQKPKRAIDDILRGPPDIKQYEKPDSGSLDQAFQLQKLISERIALAQTIGKPIPSEMSLGNSRLGILIRDAIPSDNPQRRRGSHTFFSQAISATVANISPATCRWGIFGFN